MPVSSVLLDDPRSVQIDNGPKSVAYFCRRNPVRIDVALVAELKHVARNLDGKNVRVCLHESPDAAFHEMIILEHKGKYYPPHKHLHKGESYHIIDGSLGAFVFDERGAIVDACVLEPGRTLMYRVAPNMFHAVMPLTAQVVYHEAKPGPFMGANDSVYPDWAIDAADPDALVRYNERLRAALVGQ